MKRRIIKGLVMTMVTFTLLTGCGKEEQPNSPTDTTVNDMINVEKNTDDKSAEETNSAVNENNTSQNKIEVLTT